MAKRLYIDWDSVEPLYRAGILSNYEICTQYAADHTHTQTYKKTISEGAIRKRAKEKNWQKDIAKKVQNRVSENLIRSAVRDANLSENEMVEAAAAEPIRVAKGQRARTQAALEFQDELMEELRATQTDVDVMVKVRAFKDLAHTLRTLQDQQAEQYKLNDATQPEERRFRVKRVRPEIDDE